MALSKVSTRSPTRTLRATSQQSTKSSLLMAYMRRALRMTGPSNTNRSSSRFSNAVSISMRESRNAEYVANTFVISRYTAKTHINNIYRKLGIHTREELLDLVERKKPPRNA